MKITILGTGNGATAVGADLSIKGHEVTLLKTSESNIHSEHYKYMLNNDYEIILRENNSETKTRLFNITDDYSKAIQKDTDLVIVYVQTNYHQNVIEKIAPYLNDNQVVLVEPGYLATPYFFENDKKNIVVVEAESSPIDCRIVKPGFVDVLFRNVRNPIGIYPKARREYALNKLDKLNYNFVLLDTVIDAALNNPNIIVHTVGAVMSIPRIEHTSGDYWMYREVFTPSIWNLVEKLDDEKMNVLNTLGLESKKYVEKCQYRNSVELSSNPKEIFFDYAHNSSPKGPEISDSRYITEDVSQGLVLLEKLGEVLNVDTTVCTSLINIASASLKIDFRKIGRSYNQSLDLIVDKIKEDFR